MPWKEISHLVSSASELGRVDRLLGQLLEFSRSEVRGLLQAGGVQLNGEPCSDPGRALLPRDQIFIRFDPHTRYREKTVRAAPKPRGFAILFEDEHLIVLDKEAGLLTVPSERHEDDTLVHRLRHYLSPKNPQRGRVHLVHRLDRDTSGVLVFAKSSEAAVQLIQQFAARKPERRYVAITSGRLATEQGRLESRLASDITLTQRSSPRGALAITHFKVLERFEDSSWLELQLETGKRNQIRAQLSELGHPILGDRRYGEAKALTKAWPYRRLALHALTLGFVHPLTGKTLVFEAPLPQEFLRFKNAEKARARPLSLNAPRQITPIKHRP